MHHVLYIEASPRKQRSASIAVARAFLDELGAGEDIAIDTLDLWETPLPEFDGEAMLAKYAGLAGEALTPAMRRAWDEIETLAHRFHAARTIVISLPLWNFSIPYRMKHLIDAVSQKDVLFSFDENGFSGLLRDKTAVVVYARGLDFAPTSNTPAGSYDFQRPYMEMWLNFVGVTDIRSITVEKSLLGTEVDAVARAQGRDEAQALARLMRAQA